MRRLRSRSSRDSDMKVITRVTTKRSRQSVQPGSRPCSEKGEGLAAQRCRHKQRLEQVQTLGAWKGSCRRMPSAK